MSSIASLSFKEIVSRKDLDYVVVMRNLSSIASLGSVGLFALLLATVPAANAAPTPPSIVVRMNELALETMKAAAFSPPVVSRTLALLHIGFLEVESSRKLNAAQKRATEVEYGRVLLASLMPSQAGVVNRSTTEISHAFGLRPDATTDAAADRVYAYLKEWRRDDARALAASPWVKVDDQHWNPIGNQVPALPNWGTAASFLIYKKSDWRLTIPALGLPDPRDPRVSPALELGEKSSTKRTADMGEIAQFWSQGAKTVTPPGQWNRIAQDAVRRLALSHGEQVRLFAELNTALAEVSVHCWSEKYRHLVLRPVQVAQANGNSEWRPLLETPPHPEYPSGHSSFSGAAATVLESWVKQFGSRIRDRGPIRVTSEDLPGVVRQYANYMEAAREAGMSRIYGGIHFLWSDTEGQRLGRAIANEAMRDVEFSVSRD